MSWTCQLGSSHILTISNKVALLAGKNFFHPADLVAFAGILCFLDYDHSNSRVDVLLMNDYRAENLWSKAFSVDHGVLGRLCMFLRPLEYSTRHENVLLEVDKERLQWYMDVTVKELQLRAKKISITGYFFLENLILTIFFHRIFHLIKTK